MPDLEPDVPTINVPLLRKTLEHITAHPEEWDQGVWMRQSNRTECGTAGCVAGWALTFAGHELDFESCFFPNEALDLIDGRPIETVAQAELGLTEDQANALFSEHNGLTRLWELADDYTNGEIANPFLP
jgi:hypothetical protein